MNVNKKLDRLKHWAGEKMGGEVKTNMTEEFKALEMEMTLRSEGLERMHKSMNGYIKSISKRDEGNDKDKSIPIAYLGSTMVAHGDDFEPDSEFGQCLATLGRANERVARTQESYVASATTTWLESLERSLAQMKEYQAARKKLESRRLAYDTSQAKIQKSKKEDFRMEEELRSQKAKYEESSEDVYRRMLDIKEAEVDSVSDLTAFLDAELNYYDRAREILVQAKRDWPAAPSDGTQPARRGPRSRGNTMTAFRDIQEEDPVESATQRIPVRSTRVPSAQASAQNSPRRELPGFEFGNGKPAITRNATFEGPRSLQRDSRDASPVSMPRLSRTPTESSILGVGRSQLRPVRSRDTASVFSDDNEEAAYGDYDDRSASPAPSYSSSASRSASWAYTDSTAAKKMPPPPPPSRAKKPPPPPPLKRSALSTSEVPHY